MTIESRLDVETQHHKWRMTATRTAPAEPNALELEALIKSAVTEMAAKAREDGVGEWARPPACWVTIIPLVGGAGGKEPWSITVGAKAIKIGVTQQPFTTWDKLFASLVWPQHG